VDAFDGTINGFSADKFNFSIIGGFVGVGTYKFNMTMDGGNLMLNYDSDAPQPIPEPATVVSIIGGLIVAGLRRVLKRKK